MGEENDLTKMKLGIEFRRIRDQFNKYRQLSSMLPDFEALESEMTNEEKELLCDLTKKEEWTTLKGFKDNLIIAIFKRKEIAKIKKEKALKKKEKKNG
jgi:hypothetical protein